MGAATGAVRVEKKDGFGGVGGKRLLSEYFGRPRNPEKNILGDIPMGMHMISSVGKEPVTTSRAVGSYTLFMTA